MKNLASLIESILYRNLDEGNREWLSAKGRTVREETGGTQLALAFTAMPRKTGKKDPGVTEAEQQEIEKFRAGFYVQDWSLDRLARAWLLMQMDPAYRNTSGPEDKDAGERGIRDKDAYLKKIGALFSAAEMNEGVALYSALPVLAYPEAWKDRCAEGIRSNIGTVLEAIMHRNPYPAEWLEEPAWNQLVMKAFFTDKDISQISGLKKRANKALAGILSDYARERQAAGRSVNPWLWELVELGDKTL